MAEHVHLQRGLPAAERARDKALFAELRSAPSRAERARIMAEIYRQSTGMSTLVRNRAEDSEFVLDRIETVLAAIPGYADAPSADLERVGALGFSLGGAVATLWCQIDTRCRHRAAPETARRPRAYAGQRDRPF